MRDFAVRVLDLFAAIHPLDCVPRAGYILRGVAQPESVAAHSHFVSLMTLLIVDAFPDEFDREHALTMALIHDLSEAKLMDIPMPSADAYLKDAKQHAEQHIIEDLFAGFERKYAQLHQELLNAVSPEARLVRGVDKAQMMAKILGYEREHRGNLEEFWKNPKNFNDFGLASVSAIFDEICARAGRKRPQ